MAIVALIAAFFALRIAIQSHKLADDARYRAEKRDVETPSQSHLVELSAELTEMRDAQQSLLEQLKKLRSRIGMRELRQKRANGEAEPEPGETTEAKKARLRKQVLEKRGRI